MKGINEEDKIEPCFYRHLTLSLFKTNPVALQDLYFNWSLSPVPFFISREQWYCLCSFMFRPLITDLVHAHVDMSGWKL